MTNFVVVVDFEPRVCSSQDAGGGDEGDTVKEGSERVTLEYSAFNLDGGSLYVGGVRF